MSCEGSSSALGLDLAPCLQVRTASCGATACVNTFGDEQLAVDLLADKILFEALKFSVSCQDPCCCPAARQASRALTSLSCRACASMPAQKRCRSPWTCRVCHALSCVRRQLEPLALAQPSTAAGEGFSVAFDPLDGSSIVDTNFSVGTIFGVWPGDKLKGITGR